MSPPLARVPSGCCTTKLYLCKVSLINVFNLSYLGQKMNRNSLEVEGPRPWFCTQGPGLCGYQTSAMGLGFRERRSCGRREGCFCRGASDREETRWQERDDEECGRYLGAPTPPSLLVTKQPAETGSCQEVWFCGCISVRPWAPWRPGPRVRTGPF